MENKEQFYLDVFKSSETDTDNGLKVYWTRNQSVVPDMSEFTVQLTNFALILDLPVVPVNEKPLRIQVFSNLPIPLSLQSRTAPTQGNVLWEYYIRPTDYASNNTLQVFFDQAIERELPLESHLGLQTFFFELALFNIRNERVDYRLQTGNYFNFKLLFIK